ncbi:MAG TPA: pyruvate dehydrogenase (acetyl-transferring) E1 component subunit alpha, partial [Actinobacteria bacterium]|nr:pyruvate dehydrogenase (acetyl-transferring) E1 component subunit alpha [Actinomycetota bacterium]
GEGPTLIEAVCYRFGPHATADDPHLYRTREEEEAFRPYDPLVRMERFLRDRGLWDDDRQEDLEAAAQREVDEGIAAAEALPEPGRDAIVRHAYARIPRLLVDELHRLQRGAGEEPTVFSAEELWEVGDEPAPSGPTERWTMADAINAALHDEMAADDRIVVLGEDVGVAGGVFRITAGLYERFGPERVIDTPLDEAGIVGTAVGMAVAGGRPIAEIQFDGFVYPAFDQIVSHVGRMRFRTRGHVTLPMVIRFPNGAGIGAHELHCDSPEAYFCHAAGLVVVVPSTPYDAKGLLTAAIRSEDPVLFLEPKVLYRSFREEVPVEPYEIPLGKARVRRRGTDLTIVTYGGMVPVSLRAAEAAAAEGIDVEVVDLRTVFPWDVETVTASVEGTGRLLAVQEPQRSMGVLAEVVAEVAERCGYALEAPPRRLTGVDAPWPSFGIEPHGLVNDAMVLAEIRATMAG